MPASDVRAGNKSQRNLASILDDRVRNELQVDLDTGKLFWKDREIVARKTIDFRGISSAWAWITGIAVVAGSLGAAITGYVDLCKHLEEHRKLHDSAANNQPNKAISPTLLPSDKPAVVAPKPTEPPPITTIYFEPNSGVLMLDSSAALDSVIQALSANPSLDVSILGYTDDSGTASQNTALSRLRATQVAQWIAGKGIASTRIASQGLGAAMPIADNHTPDGRAKNRRVEISLQ